MNIGEVSFYTGIILLFMGIIGGGIDIKEVKIPQITGAPRYACFIGSIVFIILGLYLKNAIPIAITNANNPTAANTTGTKAPDAPATTPAVPAQQAVENNQTQAVAPVNTPLKNTESDAELENAIEAKHQALIQLNEANQRVNAVWNSTTQEIRDALLADQNQWLKKRETDCSFQASTEQPVDMVMQEAVKLNCMATMNDHRTAELKQKIADMPPPVKTDDNKTTAANSPETEISKNQDINSVAEHTASVNSISINDAQLLAKQQAQTQLDEANKRINTVWNATTQEIRETLLPEQKQWLKQREDDCSLKAANEQPDDQVMQETFKLNCMATMTDPRTEELKQKIAEMAQ